MDPNTVAGTILGLRIFIFICLLISLAVIATDKFELIDGTKAKFSDIYGYRYVLSTAIIGFTYTMLHLGLSIYHIVTKKKTLIWNEMPTFTYYADQVMTWYLATAVGAGFGVTVELQRLVDIVMSSSGSDGVGIGGGVAELSPEVDEQKSIIDDFFNRGNISTATLFLGFISMVFIVLLSSFNHTKSVHKSNKAVIKSQDDVVESQTQMQTVNTQAA